MELGINEFYRILSENKSFIIAGHENPDGDSVAACLAMAMAVKLHGGNPTVLLSRHSKRLNIIAGREFIYEGDMSLVSGDVFIALDCGSKDRLADAVPIFDRTPVTINIDHHISNSGFAMYNCVDANAAAACEALYKLINSLIPINRDIAEALYIGIVSDSGGFRHKSTTPETLETAAKLMATGIDFSRLYREVMHISTLAETQMLRVALGKLRLFESSRVAAACVTVEEMNGADAEYSDLDGIVERLLNIDGVEAALLFSERPNGKIKVSMRSTDIDLTAIALRHGGGGHKNAAGATLDCGMDSALNIIMEEIKGALNA